MGRRPNSVKYKSPFNKRTKCSQCGLIFMKEEADKGRFFPKAKICVRCLWVQAAEEERVELPDCFGKSYSPIQPICTQVCKAREACLIETSERQSEQVLWNTAMTETKITKEIAAVRILKALGKPLHLYDLGPLIEKANPYFQRNGRWESQFRKVLRESTKIVHLGDDTYLWRGFWDGKLGEPGYRDIKKREIVAMDDEKIATLLEDSICSFQPASDKK